MRICAGGRGHPDMVALLTVHFESMPANSPPGMCHFPDMRGLAASDMRFRTEWNGNRLPVCGAVKRIGADHGEIKSMRIGAA